MPPDPSHSSAPRVSVLLPVFNGARYLPESVASIREQTYRDFELIIVDDGSTDSTPEIADNFARQDARVRVLNRPNTGVVGASNDGLALARGELVARIDHDDVAL